MNQPPLDFDAGRGRQLRDQGRRDVAAHRAARMSVIHEALRALAARKEFLTCDDLRAEVPPEHWPDHPNAWGAALTNAARGGLIRFTGRYEHSEISSNRARRIQVWQSMVIGAATRGAA